MSASPMLPQKVAEHGGGVLEHTMQLSDLPERVFGSLEEMAYPGFFRAYLHLVAAYIQPLGILEVSCLCSLSAVTHAALPAAATAEAVLSFLLG